MLNIDKQTYASNCVVEALCELQFERPEAWDVVNFGIGYEKFKQLGYDQREQVQQLMFELGVGSPKFGSSDAPSVVRFHDAKRERLVQLGPNLFAVNALRPYHGWDDFKSRILAEMKLLNEVAEPSNFTRLAVRYINRFEFDTTQLNPEQWFNISPNVPDLPWTLGPFTMQNSWAVAEGEALNLVFGFSKPEDGGEIALLLDMTYTKSLDGTFKLDSLESLVENAHSCVYHVFEACISDSMRARLNGGLHG